LGALVGVEAAIARAQQLAGDRIVAISGGTIARQGLEPGLVDEVRSTWFRS